LTKIKNVYNVTVQTEQVILKNDNSLVIVAARNGINMDELTRHHDEVGRDTAAKNPKKLIFKTVLSFLRTIILLMKRYVPEI